MNPWTYIPADRRDFRNEEFSWASGNFGGSQSDNASGGGSGSPPIMSVFKNASHTKGSNGSKSSPQSSMKDSLREKVLSHDTPWGKKHHPHDDDGQDSGGGKGHHDHGGGSPGNVYSVPEPASLIVWSMLGTLGMAFVWWRKDSSHLRG
jgi:hypothetical protein